MLKVKWYDNTTSQFDPLQVSCPFLNQIDFVIDGTRWLKEFIRTRGLAQKSQLSLPCSLGVLRYISRKNFKKVKKNAYVSCLERRIFWTNKFTMLSN